MEREANPNSMENGRSTADLPDVIIQHIQSFLKPHEAAQTILLSKSWLRAWSTRPFLLFNLLHKSSTNGKKGYPDNPSDVIDRTLKSYVDQKIPIFRFQLYVKTIQERWLKMARQSNVIELDITACNWKASTFQEIFHTKSLQVLRLNNTFFPVSCNTDHINKCLNLKKFELCWMKISEVAFQNIISSCPLIEELVLKYCRFIDFSSTYNVGSECASLKRLSLVGTKINDEKLQTILSRSPQLEDLNIIGRISRKPVEPINFSGASLKRVNLNSSLIQLVLIGAPNLQKLKFISCRFQPLAFPVTITSPITKGEVKVTIAYHDLEVDESWFLGLREFLSKIAKSNVKFISDFNLPLAFDFKVLRANPLASRVETLRFKGYKDMQLLLSFFSICHPKIVLFDHRDTMSKRKLVMRLLTDISNRGNLNCCNFDENKCWLYYIEDAKLYYVIDNEKKPLNMSGFETGLWTTEVVTLALEWKSSD